METQSIWSEVVDKEFVSWFHVCPSPSTAYITVLMIHSYNTSIISSRASEMVFAKVDVVTTTS